MSDKDTIALLRKGSRSKALDRLYKSFPSIERFVVGNGGTNEEAKDIFQEGLVIFIQKASSPQFELTSAISTYLYSVCKYLWYDHLRKQKFRTDVQPEELNIPSSYEHDVVDHVNKENKFKVLDDVFPLLGDRCIELLKRFYYQKMSMKEIASDMGYNNDKIAKNQKYKCLEKARKLAQKKLTKVEKTI